MTYRATISETDVPLQKGAVIAVTKQSNRIGDLETRSGDISNRIKIELTNPVRLLLGLTDQTNSANDAAYTRMTGNLWDGYTPLMPGADVYLLGTDGDTAELAYVNGFPALYARIKDKTLHDITTLPDHDVVWEWGSLDPVLLAKTQGEAVAIAQWGASNLGRVDMEYFHPCYYLRSLYIDLLADAGYTGDLNIAGDTDLTTFMQSMVFPFSKSNGWKHSGRFTQTASISKSAGLQQLVQGQSIATETNTLNTVLNFDDSSRYTAAVGVTFANVSATVVISNFTRIEPPTNLIDPIIAILKNGSTVVTSQIITPGTSLYTITAASVALTTSDYLEVVILRSSTVNDASNPPSFSFKTAALSFYSDDPVTDIAVGDTVTPEAYIPDINQADFLKGIFNMFGLIPKVDNIANTIELITFQSIADKIGTSEGVDWSSKLVQPEGSRVWYLDKRTDIGYSRVNRMKYKADDTLDIPEIGNADITIDDAALPPEQTLFTLPWAASERTNFAGVQLAKIPFWKSDGAGGYEQEYRPQQRIGYVVRETATVNFYQDDVLRFTETANVPFIKFIDPAQPYNLGFDNNLKARNYTAWANTINQAVELDVLLNLSGLDVHNFDPYVPYYFEQFSDWFYVDILDKYVKGTLTVGTIIKIRK